MADRKLDKPSDADFIKGITDNIPGDDYLLKNIAKGIAIAEVLKYVRKPKR